MAQPIDLAVLQAAPLTWVDEKGLVHPVPPLDFAAERERLRDSFTEAAVALSVRFEAATADSLRTVATLGARVLHYSGHGAPDFLAFEDGRGGTHPIAAATLRSLLEAGERTILLVVVSACHSRRAGEAFVKAGVPHVVAIQVAEAVFDSAAREFARAFYLALLQGQTIAQAFAIGRAQVEALPGLADGKKEKRKFVLLPAKADHSETVFSGLAAGAWNDTTPETAPLLLPASPESFLGRETEIAKVVELVLKHRLTTLRGAPGIGKTALANVAARYLGERRLMRNGVRYVALRNALSAEAARAEIASLLGIQAPDDATLFAALHPLRLLLVLDNCEDVLHTAAGAFRDFLARLLLAAPGVRILATSRHLIGALPAAGVSEIAFEVGRLAPLDAAHLFLARCPRELTLAELGNPKPDRALQTLATHRALRFLAGHPLAIGLAAPVLADRTLDQLADLLETTPASTLAVSGLPEKDRDANLGATFEVSIRQVEEIDPEAVRLFSVMGLVPGGAFPEDLDAIWGDPSWRTRMDLLIRRGSLVQFEQLGDKTERYSTFPFVTAMAEARLTENDRREFGLRALGHFGDLSKTLYQSLGGENAQTARMLFTLHEPNLRACLTERRPRPEPPADPLRWSDLTRLAFNLPRLLLLEHRLADTRSAADLAAKACGEAKDRLGVANTRHALGDLALRSDDLQAARDDYRAALDLFRQIGERLGEANTRKALGDLALRSDELPTARENYRAALDLFRQIGARQGEAYVLMSVGDLHLGVEEWDSAIECYKAALPIFQAIGAKLGTANTLIDLGRALFETGHQAEGIDAVQKAALLFVEAQNPTWANRALRHLAEMLEAAGRSEEAAEVRARLE